MRTAIAAAVLVAATLVAAACVETPDPETPDPVANQPAAAADTAARDRAKASYQAGVEAYSAGDFTAAVAAFDAAYRDFPSPAFLFNSAQAYRNLGDRDRAIALYRQFLAAEPTASDAIRDSVQERIDELSAPRP